MQSPCKGRVDASVGERPGVVTMLIPRARPAGALSSGAGERRPGWPAASPSGEG